MSIDLGLDETKFINLKHELKEWEKLFAANNGGRKPGRDDMKRDAIISIKYKEYERLRKQSANTKITPRKDTRAGNGNSTVLKERPTNLPAATPKRHTKDKQSAQSPRIAAVVEQEPTPACVRFGLGPTPQKDGEVLGIFDGLIAGTPSKGPESPDADQEITISATPSKGMRSLEEAKLSKTPQSSGKRFFLGAFAGTPLKRKREDEDGTPSTTKRQFATPSFLRRNVPLARIDEDADEVVTTVPPFKRRGLVRSLSTMIQGLRKQEDETLDDEWDILREIEEEESGNTVGTKAPKVLVEDSQAAEMPLGPDKGPNLSDDDEVDVDPGSLDANGQPRKVWKKKGQKRQTKRTKMRPQLHKPRKAADAEPAADEEDVVEETQNLSESVPAHEAEACEQEREDDHDDEEESDFEDETKEPSGAHRSKKRVKRKAAEPKTEDDNEDKKGRKPRKVSAQAHANFRRLKIKNKNSKANGRSKFGRR